VESVSRIDDLELGCDLPFEHRWWRVQRICWGVMILLLLGGVAGVFGNGPLSEVTANSPDGALQVRYERLARRETPAILELHLKKPVLARGQVRIRLNHTLVSRLRIKTIVPAPLKTEPLADGARFTFRTDPTVDSATVLFVEDPSRPGLIEGEVAVEGAEAVRFRQFVYP
jgi:hypothetical protein